MRLISLGDSHSLFSFAGVDGVKIYWRGPVTMHRAARDGLLSLIPKNYRATSKDILILSFGEIDCRAHLVKQARRNGRSAVQEADILCDRYYEALKRFSSGFPGKLALSCIIPLNINTLDTCDYNDIEACLADAVAVRRRMNERLEAMGFPFVDFREFFDAGNGTIIQERSDFDAHIDSRLSQPVIDAIRSSLSVECLPRIPPWPWPKALAEPEYKPLIRRVGKRFERVVRKAVRKTYSQIASYLRTR